jgi:hypothetical protein
MIPNEDHHPTGLLKFLDKIIGEEDTKQITNDYSVVLDASGHSDLIYFCNFEDGNSMNERGPNFLKRVWASESPIIDQCVLTNVIVGKWPFNKNGYVKWSVEREGEKDEPLPQIY